MVYLEYIRQYVILIEEYRKKQWGCNNDEEEYMNIVYENEGERFDFEAMCKGYREDVYVYLGKKKYQLSVYTTTRLIQDFELEIQEYGFYQMPINLILVEEISKDIINNTIHELNKRNFFENLVECRD